MASTTFSGPVTSTNGFIGTVTGNAAGATAVFTTSVSTPIVAAADGTSALTFTASTGAVALSGASLTVSAKNIITDTTTGMKIGTATTQKLGFYNATPVVQPATTGTTTGFTAGSGTAAKDDSTFTGNTGTAAYTVGDIVKALKNLGLLAA